MESQESRRLASTLEHLAHDGAAVAQVAAAVVCAWSEIEAALTPVIGHRGVGALYERSLFLIRPRHQWLARIPENVEARMDLDALQALLVQQDCAAAAAGAGDHLQALHDLLGSLIGQALTQRILGPIWSRTCDDLPHRTAPND